jgi:hypothetical protein
MATTINQVSIRIGADTQLARNEINSLKTILRQSQDPVEVLNNKVRILDKALSEGAITAQQHARGVEMLGDKAKGTSSVFDVLNSKIVGMATAAAAIAAAKKTVDLFAESVERVDSLADKAAGMGAEYNKLKIFAAALAEVGGLSFDQSIDGLKQLNQQVGMASIGMGKGLKFFERLGLDPKELAKLDPTEQFDRIANELLKIESAAERAAIAGKLFGDPQVAGAIATYGETIGRVSREISSTTLVLSEEEISRLSKTSDRIERLKLAFSSAQDKAAAFAVSNEGIVGITQQLGGSVFALATQAALTYAETLNSPMLDESLKKHQQIAEQVAKENAQLEEMTVAESRAQLDRLLAAERLNREIAEEEERRKEIVRLEKENAKIAEDNARIEQQRAAIELAGIADIQKLKQDYADKAASAGGDTRASFISIETKQAFDFEAKRNEKQNQILEESRDLQKKIADASEKTAEQISKLKPIKAAR